ncbi:MAG: TldD/PmbA family protein [Candidatus Aenigmarchaeota archaeon]|nr:TldD/PmbA family protein [Candidatus Aenigmarchaeota archaeon]
MDEFKSEYLISELKRKGADDVIVSLDKVYTTQIKFVNNKICNSIIEEETRATVFAAIEKKIVFMSFKGNHDLNKIANKIAEMSKYIQPNKEYGGIAKGPFKYREHTCFDENINTSNFADIVERGINTALKSGAKRASGTFRAEVYENQTITSNNVNISEKGTKAYLSLRVFVDQYASGHDVSVSRKLSQINPEETAKNAVKIAIAAQKPKELNCGRYDVVFSSLPAADILDQVGMASSCYSVDAGLSCFKDKINKRVASEKVNLYDDGTIKTGIDATLYDAEGMPTQRTPIIEEGILKTYLHNTSTAKRYNTTTTANAGLIEPLPTTIVLKEGNLSQDEMIKRIEKGLLVTNVWYTRFQNYNTGDFSTIPRDGIFYVENGKIKYPVKEIRIKANIIDFLSNIAEVGNDTKQILSWSVESPVFCPSILVKNIEVTKPDIIC